MVLVVSGEEELGVNSGETQVFLVSLAGNHLKTIHAASVLTLNLQVSPPVRHIVCEPHPQGWVSQFIPSRPGLWVFSSWFNPQV